MINVRTQKIWDTNGVTVEVIIKEVIEKLVGS
jgi:hypothetical protein